MSNPTSAQIDALLTFLEDHRELARGHLRNAEGRIMSRNLWAEVTAKLNALGGCIKSMKQWQKVWADKKYLAKKAAGAARKSASATGGGPSSAGELTHIELRIINIMGEGYGNPESDARAPAFPEIPARVSPEEVTEQHQQPQEQQSPAHQHINTSTSQQRRRRYRDNTGLERNVRNRLFLMEEQRVAAETARAQELSLIRQSLQDVCAIMYEILNVLKK